MAYRKMVHIQTLEAFNQEDYEADKAFVIGRYGPGGTNNPPAFTYEFDDTNRKIILTRVDNNWEQPQ